MSLDVVKKKMEIKMAILTFRRVLVGVIACFSVPTLALAADIPERTEAPSPYMSPVPVANWTGFYVGGNIGYGIAGIKTNLPPVIAGTLGLASSVYGVVGGIQVGHNWQNGNVVYGLEADFNASSQKRTLLNLPPALGSFRMGTKIPYFATVRMRLGYSFNNVIMTYLTGGLAWGRYEISASAVLPAPFGAVAAKTGKSKFGFAGGAGVEWKVAKDWSAKLEVLYLRSTQETLTLPGSVLRARAHNLIVRTGLNRHF